MWSHVSAGLTAAGRQDAPADETDKRAARCHAGLHAGQGEMRIVATRVMRTSSGLHAVRMPIKQTMGHGNGKRLGRASPNQHLAAILRVPGILEDACAGSQTS